MEVETTDRKADRESSQCTTTRSCDKMASLAYYAKNLFASSYGKDRPDFFIWHPKGLPTSEKKLLFKIDLFILSYACMAYFTKWLDQANLSNAYVSGMREDLQMYGNQYNLAATCFSVGQILGPIPANILLTWIPPRFLLPGLELIWAGLTIGTYAVKDVNQVRQRKTKRGGGRPSRTSRLLWNLKRLMVYS